MLYLDQALKLDVRSLMAVAMKSGQQSAYSITIRCQTGQVICRELRDSPDRVATWRVSCPETRQQVPALYLAPDGDRFLSREATGLKYRRANSKADRALRRGFKLMQKLQTDHWGPGIGKPPGMSDRVFDRLNDQLTKEHIRYMCALLGKADPEFDDEEPPPPKHTAQQPRQLHRSMVRDPSVYYRDKSGTLKMRAKFEKKKFGLTTPTH
jgi:hypothetical protein